MKKITGFVMSAVIGAIALTSVGCGVNQTENYDYGSNLSSVTSDFLKEVKSKGHELSCFENQGCDEYWVYFTKSTCHGTIGSACTRANHISDVINIIKSY